MDVSQPRSPLALLIPRPQAARLGGELKLPLQAASSALSIARSRLRSEDNAGDFSTNLHAFCKLLFEDPLVSAALTEVLSQHQSRANALDAARRSLLDALRPHVAHYNSVSALATTLLAQVDRRGGNTTRAREVGTAPLAWGTASKTLAEILTLLSDPSAFDSLTIDQLWQFREHVLPAAMNFRDLLRDQLGGNGLDAELNERLARIEALLKPGVNDLLFARELCATASFEGRITNLRVAYEELDSLFRGATRLPFAPDSCLRQLSSENARRTVVTGAAVIAEAVLHVLDLGPVRHHVLMRAVLQLEVFGKRRVIQDLAHAKATSGRLEDVLQLCLDGFIFLDGLVPIIHTAASGGSIDTFVEDDHADLFEAVERTDLPPLLLELKQELTLDPKASVSGASIRSAISDARSQAGIYERYLRLKPRWASSRVYAVVVYDGCVRYRTSDRDVILVYLGPKRPSEGTTALGAV
jgi:hypothetical protein